MKQVHPLLRRQLKKHFPQGELPSELNEFIDAVSKAYYEFDADRNLLERSLECSSQELFQANMDLRALFEAFPDLFFRITTDGTILDCRAGKTAALVYPPEKLIGKKIQDVPSKRLKLEFERQLAHIRKTKEMMSFEYMMELNNQKHFFEARMVPFREEQLLMIVRNINDRKKMEAQLVQSQKMEMVGSLAGGIAHDLNNHLMPLMGYVDLALLSITKEEDIYPMLIEANKGARQCSEIVAKILNFSKPSTLKKELIPVEKLFQDTGGLLRKMLPATIQMVISWDPNVHDIYVNETELQTVLLNLAANSRDAMAGEGRFELKAENAFVKSESQNKNGEVMLAECVLLSVTDTGTGISPEIVPKIFEPFFSTKEQGRGTGLGLTMVFNIIKNHQGTIDVVSTEGKGTAFHIYLPAFHKTVLPVTSELPAPSISSLPHGSETVLLAEDEEDVRKLNRIFLEKLGYHVLLAENGEEMLKVFLKNKNEVGVVILDMTMPKMTGREALQRLIQLRPGIKVILISGFTNEASVEELLVEGASEFIPKPFSIETLARTLNKVIKTG